MVNQSDAIHYDHLWFDGDAYIQKQREAIMERISHFPGKLYLEIGGKFLYDSHASRVLPWFYPDTKKRIFSQLMDVADVVFCINAYDLLHNRQLTNEPISYEKYVDNMLRDIYTQLHKKAIIVINMIDDDNVSHVEKFVKKQEGYSVVRRYKISWYPTDLDVVISEEGYGKDESVISSHDLVLVTGAASNSGKMSTCLGQVYKDNLQGIDSWYAKYETFPIWNVPLDHPVNVAYEAATADIYDYNCIDSHHLSAYGKSVVNYNRDVDAFPLVSEIIQKIVPETNYMCNYKSPTDMGISTAGFCLTDQKVLRQAAYDEVQRRMQWYQEMVDRGDWKKEWVEACRVLLSSLE